MAAVLCNASPLMALGKLNRLDLLAGLFDEVRLPRAVYDEVVPQALLTAYAPPVVLDPGETEVLALAQSLGDPLVLLDDEIARAEARRLNLRLCGTLGILVRAHRGGLISLDQAELLIREIAARPDIWIAARLCEQVLVSLPEAGS
jgi:hypothetical protein